MRMKVKVAPIDSPCSGHANTKEYEKSLKLINLII